MTALSYFDNVGTASSIGEQPAKMLVNIQGLLVFGMVGLKMSQLEQECQ